MSSTLKKPATEPVQTVAAVDLGSNSFHMIVVRAQGRELHVLDRLKESVRLAAGIDDDRRLSDAACDRAIACLERFGQRLRGLPGTHVRAVGTNTLRHARATQDFMARAHDALGHPIEIIYGAEEARLIYGGVAQDLGSDRARRLVVDIGGGSTELIIGEHTEPRLVRSTPLGAVVQTQRFFPNGKIGKKAWQAAIVDVRLALEPLALAYRNRGWDLAIGASGSIKSVLRAATDSDAAGATITPEALHELGQAVVKAGHIDKLSLPGLSDDRRPIFAGGLAVLTGIFDSLGVEAMEVSDKALREGLVADLLGRLEDHDVREDSVTAAAARYRADPAQAERVAETAMSLLDEGLPAGTDRALAMRLLRWAALLHEIGLAISHKSYHKHGEYIVRHADLHGFSQNDQALLASIIRLHRGKYRPDVIEALPAESRALAEASAVALRLAVILHRGRNPDSHPQGRLSVQGRQLTLGVADRWLARRPLTQADLVRETGQLARAGLDLRIEDDDDET